MDLVHENRNRLTFSEGMDIGTLWSPDNKYIVFSSDRDSKSGVCLYRKASDGTGEDEELASVQKGWSLNAGFWSGDEKSLILSQMSSREMSLLFHN